MRVLALNLLVVAIFICVLCDNANAQLRCGANNVDSDCVPSCWSQPRCVNFVGDDCPEVETDECRRGCVCRKGYARVDQVNCELIGSPKCPSVREATDEA